MSAEGPLGASTTIDLVQLGPKLFVGAGTALLLLAAYMAGQDTLHCDRANGRVDCVVERHRWLGRIIEERQSIVDVVNAGVHTSTTSTTWYTNSGNPETTTSTNEVMVLQTRDGHDTDTLGGERSGEFAETVSALIGPKLAEAAGPAGQTPGVDLADSSWPVAAACSGMGSFFFAFGAIAFYVQRKEGA
jgi:hypothetical protein